MQPQNGNGRFMPGNPGGPGRPPAKVEADYLKALSETVSLDDWRGIAERAKSDALNGNAKAREWLSRYLMGSKAQVEVNLGEMTAEIRAKAHTEVWQELVEIAEGRSTCNIVTPQSVADTIASMAAACAGADGKAGE